MDEYSVNNEGSISLGKELLELLHMRNAESFLTRGKLETILSLPNVNTLYLGNIYEIFEFISDEENLLTLYPPQSVFYGRGPLRR